MVTVPPAIGWHQVGLALQSVQEHALRGPQESDGGSASSVATHDNEGTVERKGVEGDASAQPQQVEEGEEEEEEEEEGRPHAVNLDELSRADSSTLGPLGRAWVEWTKACRRQLRDVRVTPATAVALENRDAFGRIVDVVPMLGYTVPSAELKKVPGLGPRARFVPQPLSPAQLAANRACVTLCVATLHAGHSDGLVSGITNTL